MKKNDFVFFISVIGLVSCRYGAQTAHQNGASPEGAADQVVTVEEMPTASLFCEEQVGGTFAPSVTCTGRLSDQSVFKGTYRDEAEVTYESGESEKIKVSFSNPIAGNWKIIKFQSSQLKYPKFKELKIVGSDSQGNTSFVATEIKVLDETGGQTVFGNGGEASTQETSSSCVDAESCGFGLK